MFHCCYSNIKWKLHQITMGYGGWGNLGDQPRCRLISQTIIEITHAVCVREGENVTINCSLRNREIENDSFVVQFCFRSVRLWNNCDPGCSNMLGERDFFFWKTPRLLSQLLYHQPLYIVNEIPKSAPVWKGGFSRIAQVHGWLVQLDASKYIGVRIAAQGVCQVVSM